MGASAEGKLGSFEERFGEGGVCVDGISDIIEEGIEFEGEGAFAE